MGELARLAPTPEQFDPITEELRLLGLPPLTDVGNAERFAAFQGGNVRYVHKWDVWLVWDGRRWAVDHQREVYRLAADTIRLVKGEVPALSNKAADAVMKHVMKSERKDRLEAMLSLARSYAPLAVVPEQLDRDPYALNVNNGTIDLKTGRLYPHRQEALLTKLVPIDFDASAEAPAWERFLARILPDEAVREYVRRAVGYSFTGDVSEHCLVFAHGGGRNGKTTLLERAQKAAGEYARAAPPDLLLAKRNDRHEEELAELHGARFVTTVEAGEGRFWDETRVKWLTGGDTLTARHLYQKRFQFTPSHHLWVAANHKPHVRGTDTGFWRRVHMVPFSVTIPEDEVDPDLPARLDDELPGILRWIVDGAVAWAQDGLRPPPAVRAATDEYRSREDVLGHFIADCCVLHPRAWVPTQAIHDAYERWAESNGERPMSKIELGNALEERAGIARKAGSKKVRGLSGIGLAAAGGEGGDLVPFGTSVHDARAGEEVSETTPNSPPSPPPTHTCREAP